MATAPTSIASHLPQIGRAHEADRAAPAPAKVEKKKKYRYETVGTVPFVLTHLAVFGAIWSGVTWQSVVLCAVLVFVNMFSVTAFYHRYFSHKTYQTSRVFQFVMAWMAQGSVQRGALWWAAHHRAHHLYSDTERDLHSAKQDGFWHAHFGWLFSGNTETDWKRVKDLSKYPELRVLNKLWLLQPTINAVASYFLFGWAGVFIGFFLSTVISWHATYFINSLCHVWGKRRFETKDTSRNNFFLALVTLGEGWHNNHHHYMSSCRQGFYWWEIDITYYLLRGLAAVGLIWDIKEPPQRVLDEGRRLDAARAAKP